MKPNRKLKSTPAAAHPYRKQAGTGKRFCPNCRETLPVARFYYNWCWWDWCLHCAGHRFR